MKSFLTRLYLMTAAILLVSCSLHIGELESKPSDSDYDSDAEPVSALANTVSLDDKPFRVTEKDVRRLTGAAKPGKECTISPVADGKDTLMYVCNFDDDGWMIVSGDRRSDPIIAGSSTGEFSVETAPEGVLIWLGSYAERIKALKDVPVVENENTGRWDSISPALPKNHKDTSSQTRIETDYRWVVLVDSTTVTFPEYDMIPHLITTKWGQYAPWYNSLPLDVSPESIPLRCLTGCTAVACSQMLYHSISTYSTVSGPTTDIGFSRSNFDYNSSRWDQMAVNKNDTAMHNTSYVGDLMLDVGNHLGMEYSWYASWATLATNIFSTYYGISCATSDYSYYTVLTNLDNGMPVIVRADSEKHTSGFWPFITVEYSGGHAWIIDGRHRQQWHYYQHKHVIHTEDWASYPYGEVFEYFGQVRAKYGINDPSDHIVYLDRTDNLDFLLMNWGEDGA